MSDSATSCTAWWNSGSAGFLAFTRAINSVTSSFINFVFAPAGSGVRLTIARNRFSRLADSRHGRTIARAPGSETKFVGPARTAFLSCLRNQTSLSFHAT